jgi:transcriptional/translational regulatory protein YebC/TACO1
MFKKRGIITVEKGATDEDRLIEVALEAGADDVSSSDDSYQVLTPLDKFAAVRDAIDRASIPIAHAEVTMIPDNTVQVAGSAASQLLKLMEELEDHDDVQNVAANFDISDQDMAQYSAA